MQRTEPMHSHFLRFRPFSYRQQHAARDSLLASKRSKLSCNTGQAISGASYSASVGAAAFSVVDEVETENEPRQQAGATTSGSGSTLPAKWNPEDLDDSNIHRTLKSLQSRQEAAAQQFVLVGNEEAERSGRRAQSTASNIARFRRRSLKRGTVKRRSHAAVAPGKRLTADVVGKPLEWDEEVELCSALKVGFTD